MERPYAYDEYEEYGWKAQLKKILKYAIIFGIIIAIGWFLYDYFIGSILTVPISVVDLEGKVIKDSHITVLEAGSNTTVFEESGLPTYQIKLRRGLYTVRAEAGGYKSESKQFEFGTADLRGKLKLEKDMDLKIKEIQMPAQLFANQNFDIVVKIENEGKEREEFEFGYEDEFEEYNCSAVEERMVIQGKEIKDFNANCTVPSATGLKSTTRGDERKGTVYIKFIDESETKKFMLYPGPRVTFSSEVELDRLHPIENPKEKGEFTIQNRSRFELYDVELSIEVSSAKKNNLEEVKNWVSFTNASKKHPREILIGIINARDKHTEPVEITIPSDAKQEKIFGSIIVEAPFLESEVRKGLVIEIRESAEINLSVDLDDYISIGFDEGKPENEVKSITLENKGDMSIENIDLYKKNFDECTDSWLAFETSTSIPELKPGETKEVFVNASTPNLAEVNENVRCIIAYSYAHPLTSEIMEREAGIIQVKRTR